MKTLLIAAFVLLSFVAQSQTELTFDLGGQYVPVEFYRPFLNDQNGSWPMLEASLGFQQEIGRSNFYWAAGLSYQHARNVVDLNFPDVISNDIPGSKGVDSYNFAGVNLGLGGKIKFRDKSVAAILFPLKAKLLFPFNSKSFLKLKNGERALEYPIYPDKYYSRGILYGINFSPKYQFNFSGKRSDPWRFSAGLQAEYLIRNNSDGADYFLFGGTLGVSYQLIK